MEQDDKEQTDEEQRLAAARSKRIVRLVGLAEYAIACNLMIVVVIVAYAAGSVLWTFVGSVGVACAFLCFFLEIDLP